MVHGNSVDDVPVVPWSQMIDELVVEDLGHGGSMRARNVLSGGR